SGDAVLQGVCRGASDAQAAVASGGRRQWPRDHPDNPDQGTGGVHRQGRFQRGWLSNRATCGRLASWARKCQTSKTVPSAKTIANHHGETPKNPGMVVSPVSQLFIQVLKSARAPFLMAA